MKTTMFFSRANNLGLSLFIFVILAVCLGQSSSQKFNDEPPQYNYESLPKTSFTCKGKLTGRYYADPETDCQMFHVCVRMSKRDVQDFRFLCPNGTVFDQEHQVCIDYYQVVCHFNLGTNPLGQIFEILRLSATDKNQVLDIGRVPPVDPEFLGRNTLGSDDFQEAEHNNNHLATSNKNALNYQSDKKLRNKEDIFYQVSATPSTTTTTTTTTKRPLVFKSPITTSSTTTTTTTESPSSYYSEAAYYDDRLGNTNVDDDFRSQSSTARPQFQSTYRASSPFSNSATPSPQTYQQQPSRFNDDFFRRIPETTNAPVSKAAQFFLHSESTDDYYTPEIRQPTTNPFVSTTVRSVAFEPSQSSFRPSPSSGGFIPSHGIFMASTYTDFSRTTPTTTPDPFFQGRSIQSQGFNSVTEKPYRSTTEPQIYQSSAISRFDRPSSPLVSRSTTPEPPSRVQAFDPSTQYFQPSRRYQVKSTTTPTTTTTESPPTTENIPFFQTGKIFVKDHHRVGTSPKVDKTAIFFKTSAKSQYNYDFQDYQDTSGTSSIFYESTKAVDATPATDVDIEYASSSRIVPDMLADASTEPTQTTTTVVTPRPVRRGGRRRVNPNRQKLQPGSRQFDPQLKYARRTELLFKEAQDRNREIDRNNKDEIFHAEASVYNGPSKDNSFANEDKKVSERYDEITKATTTSKPETYGRRLRPGRRQQQQSRKVSGDVEDVPNEVRPEDKPAVSSQPPPRLIKRLRKTTTTTTTETPTSTTKVIEVTPTPKSSSSESTSNPKIGFNVSTYRPVSRVSVKTKTVLGRRQGQGAELRRLSSTTTPEPELVTASDEEIQRKRILKAKKFTTVGIVNSEATTPFPTTFFAETTTTPTATTNQAKLPVIVEIPRFNTTSIIVKVSSRENSEPLPTPFSIRKPILSKFALRKLEKDTKEGKESTEDHTRSPDYDYAYYNTDDEVDYTVDGKDKHYGKKGRKSAANVSSQL